MLNCSDGDKVHVGQTVRSFQRTYNKQKYLPTEFSNPQYQKHKI